VEQRHQDRHCRDEVREPPAELVLDALFLLDQLLGPLERLLADFGGGLMDAAISSLIARCAP